MLASLANGMTGFINPVFFCYSNNNLMHPSSPIESCSSLLKVSLSFFPKSGSVLDLGCGTGRDALFLAERRYRVTAVDSSEEELSVLRTALQEKKDANVTVVQSDAATYPLHRQPFDSIVCNNLLQFLARETALELLGKMQANLPVHGLLLISSFTTEDPSAKKPTRLPMYFEPQELLRLFRGFRIRFYLETMIHEAGHRGMPEPHEHGIVRIAAEKQE